MAKFNDEAVWNASRETKTNPDWLLTDEEMKPIFDECLNSPTPKPFLQLIAKAQAKKLVIAISENSHMGDKYLHVNPQWWQALKKEVE